MCRYHVDIGICWYSRLNYRYHIRSENTVSGLSSHSLPLAAISTSTTTEGCQGSGPPTHTFWASSFFTAAKRSILIQDEKWSPTPLISDSIYPLNLSRIWRFYPVISCFNLQTISVCVVFCFLFPPLSTFTSSFDCPKLFHLPLSLYPLSLVFVSSPRLPLFSHANSNLHLPSISRHPPLVLWGCCLPQTLCCSLLPIVNLVFLFHLFLSILILDFFLLDIQHFWNFFFPFKSSCLLQSALILLFCQPW